jgi:multidrug resistance efflux pump
MNVEQRIPLSPAVRWRRIRYRAVPLMSFLFAVVASSFLWRNYGGTAQSVGEVDSPRVIVTSPTAGLVMSLPHSARGQWLVYDHVQAGEVIARVEDQQLEKSKNMLQQDVQKLIDEVTVQGEAASDVAARGPIYSAWQAERSRLMSLDEQFSPTLQLASDASNDAAAKSAELPGTAPAAMRDAMVRVRETRLVLERQLSEIQRSTKAAEIQAPISGTLVAVHCWPGQTVPTGGRIATIAADFGRHIVSYIPEGSPLVARPGMQVTLRARAAGARRLTSEVEQVGRRVERIPGHQIASSKSQMWGTPVRIKMPAETILQPGSLVDVVYNNSSSR